MNIKQCYRPYGGGEKENLEMSNLLKKVASRHNRSNDVTTSPSVTTGNYSGKKPFSEDYYASSKMKPSGYNELKRQKSFSIDKNRDKNRISLSNEAFSMKSLIDLEAKSSFVVNSATKL